MCKLRDRTSHADFMFILIKAGIHPLKTNSILQLFLKKAFLFAETNYFCTIVSEDLVNSDDVTPRLSSARSRRKRFALHTLTRSN